MLSFTAVVYFSLLAGCEARELVFRILSKHITRRYDYPVDRLLPWRPTEHTVLFIGGLFQKIQSSYCELGVLVLNLYSRLVGNRASSAILPGLCSFLT